MNDYNCSNKAPPGQPIFSPRSAEQEREFDINKARNHLRHPERVTFKVLLWARAIVEEYERKPKMN